VNPQAITGSTQAQHLVIPSLAMNADDSLPNDVETLKSMLIAERAARMAAEGEANYRALLIEKLKYTINKLRHEQFGPSSERGALLDQLELQLADLGRGCCTSRSSSGREDYGAVVRTAQAGAASAARAPAARTHRLSGTLGLPVLRR
jgi:hypothetical protein